MTNLIQAFEHRVIEPTYYQRRFENDLRLNHSQGEQSWQETAKRCALIVVPFLSLYKPLGTAISLSMGVVRSITSLSSAWNAGQQRAILQCSMALFQTAVAVFSVAATIFSFTGGLVIITGIDTITSAVSLIQHLANQEWEEALEELLQTAIGVLYCVSMVSGQLEIILVIALLQGLLSAYQSRQEFIAGRYPEAIAKIIMGLARVYQVQSVAQQIQRRNALLSMEKYRRLSERVFRGKESIGHLDSKLHDQIHRDKQRIEHLAKSPLQDLKVVVENNEVVFKDAHGKTYSFGSHFHAYGKGLVKGANLTFRQITVNGENKIELDFKVNHVFRENLENTIQEMKSLEPSELKDMLQLSHSHASDIHIQEGKFILADKELGSRTDILFDGLGTIMVGGSSDYPNLYDRVIVQLDEGKSLYAWHEALSLLDLDTALHTSTQEDIARIKIGQLFRTMHPREALPLERSDPFFDLPIDQLKAKIIEQNPDMKEAFETYLDKMEPREILPGRVRYAMPGIAEKSRELGARGLVAAVTGAYSNEALFGRVGSILKMGMLSSDTRFSNGIATKGASSVFDFQTGGADSVYAQMVTAQNCADNMPLDDLFYDSKVRLSISLKALETGPYQYYSDSFGSRSGFVYAERPSLFEFIENHHREANGGHELCFKERISPDLIQGLIVEDANTRKQLLDYLRQVDLIQTNARGQEMVLNRPVDQFVRVGTHTNEKLFQI